MKRQLRVLALVLTLALVLSGAALADSRTFVTHLTGSEEVPARDTLAQGQAIFRLSADGSELYFKLIVANIENVTAAHIHSAPPGTNGGVVVGLYTSGLIPGRTDGVLAEGVITGGAVTTVLDLIASGNAYVNVHSTLYPGGEIRGQID
ncbi:MAG: CHRD domain-containing protein [Anaerolineae bacterium]